MKQHKRIVMQTQERFNNAFNRWLESGAIQGGSDWDIMFECIVQVCSNVAKSMTKKKHFINDVEDKALACACAIMEHDIFSKHTQIKYLGAYVREPLMNYLWHPSVIRREHESLELHQKKCDKEIIEGFLQAEDEENLYMIDDVGCMTASDVRHNQKLIDDTFLSEWGY